MRGDVMKWVGRLVAVVFLLGILSVVAGVVTMVRQGEGVPFLPVILGVTASGVLVLLAGACLAMISIAISARRGVAALQAMAAAGPVARPDPVAVAPDAAEPPVEEEAIGPFTPNALRETVAAPARPVRPAGRILVAER